MKKCLTIALLATVPFLVGAATSELFRAKYIGAESFAVIEHIDQAFGPDNHKRILLGEGQICVNDPNGKKKLLIGTIKRDDGEHIGAIVFVCPDGTTKAITLDADNDIAIQK